MNSEAMDNQHSVKFFTLFLENLKLLCKSHLTFDKAVEVSGYVCLELDNCKKERYFLSELIQNSGTVSSASCCTQVVETSQTDSNTEAPTTPCNVSHHPERLGSIQTEMSEDLGHDDDSSGSQVVENTEELDRSISEIASSVGQSDEAETDIRQTSEMSDTLGYPSPEPRPLDFSASDVDLHPVQSEVEKEVKDKLELISVPNIYFQHNSEEVQHLKERIQAISSAKMSVPWLGTPFLHSMRNADRPETQSQDRHAKSQCTSTSAAYTVSNSFPVNVSGADIQQISQSTGVIPASSNLNVPYLIQNGEHVLMSGSVPIKANVNVSGDISHLGANYKMHQLMNMPSRQSKKGKATPTYRVRQNQRYAIRQFENFLKFKGLEVVPIYTIPPVQLDEMLCEFIKWVKKTNGEDFHPWSVKNFFYHLEYHLKEFGYACSITKGAEFKKSRDVLRQKITDLETRLHDASRILYV